jgi:phage tail protein X
MKVAVTERDWVIVTVQVSLPEQPPDQLSNVNRLSGVAVSVTVCEARNPAVHGVASVGPVHEIPSGSEVTVPTPSTVTLNVPPSSKVAVTERAAFIETEHVPCPLHAPLQPENT